jgi:TonB family protein
MNRLQKKCFLGSAGVHLLLVVVLFIGPAFLTSKSKVDDMPPLDVIPWKTVDAMVSGGGNPQARPPVAAPAPPVPAPPVVNPTPPPVTPEKPAEPVKEPQTPKEVQKTKTETESFEASKTPKRRLPNVSTKIVKATPDTHKTSRRTDSQEQERADAQRQAIASAISRTASSLRNDVSPSTTVDTNYGPGGGGEAYANYAQVVKSVYQQAWVLPDTSADEAIVKVKVTIASDGRVVASEIVRGSGDAAVDTSIQRTLERVTFVRPFPEGAKEKERTYPISFSLKAKRMLG